MLIELSPTEGRWVRLIGLPNDYLRPEPAGQACHCKPKSEAGAGARTLSPGGSSNNLRLPGTLPFYSAPLHAWKRKGEEHDRGNVTATFGYLGLFSLAAL